MAIGLGVLFGATFIDQNIVDSLRAAQVRLGDRNSALWRARNWRPHLELKRHLVESLEEMGFKVLPATNGPNASGITTCLHPKVKGERLLEALTANEIVVSLRHDRSGRAHLRIAPHFYNTFDEIAKLTEVVGKQL